VILCRSAIDSGPDDDHDERRRPTPSFEGLALRTSSRDLALIATFTGVIAALGLVPAAFLPGFPAPITLQSAGVVLVGAILGARRGALSVILFLTLVALGLPLLAGGRGGLGVFATASVGFLLAWPPAAALVGHLTQRRGIPYQVRWGLPINIVGGMLVIYAGGLIGLLTVAGLTLPAALSAIAIFIPGDLVKMTLAAFIARAVHSASPELLPRAVADPAAA
jgi:biotin transport system substrate-specific component